MRTLLTLLMLGRGWGLGVSDKMLTLGSGGVGKSRLRAEIKENETNYH